MEVELSMAKHCRKAWKHVTGCEGEKLDMEQWIFVHKK